MRIPAERISPIGMIQFTDSAGATPSQAYSGFSVVVLRDACRRGRQTALSAAQRMRHIPVTRNSAVTLLLAGALPFFPLLTAKIPQTILKMLLKVAA